MKYKKLGNSGMLVSELALGTMYFGDETSQNDAFKILDTFVEAGGTLIDTANVYVGSLSEKIIGQWISTRPRDLTDKIVLATKGRFGGPDLNDVGLSRRNLERSLNASLERLKRDTIDLYQLHASDMHTPMEETISFLNDAIHRGKIHYIGLSNFTGWQLQLFISTAKEMGVQVPVSLQPQYSLLSREIEWEIAPAAIHNNIGLLPWSPLAGGFLAGKYQRGSYPLPNTRAGSKKELYQWVCAEYAESDRNWKTIETVKQIAKESGNTPTQVALNWLINRPGVTAPIFGARTLEQLKENLGAITLKLDDNTISQLDIVSAPISGGYPYGAFGTAQRARWINDGKSDPLIQPYAIGSKYPLGKILE